MSATYAAHVKPPKVPGALAIASRHRSEQSLLIDVEAARSRADLGDISWSGPLSDTGYRHLQRILHD